MCTGVAAEPEGLDLRSVAKVDLHRHLEGSVRLGTLLDLYREAGRPLPEGTSQELAPRAQVLEPMASLEAVLSRFEIAQGAFFDEAACERIAYEAVEDLAADQVRLAELRFSPGFLCEPHGLDWDAALAAIVRGVERGSREHGVAIGLIAIASRNYGLASAERTVEFARRIAEGSLEAVRNAKRLMLAARADAVTAALDREVAHLDGIVRRYLAATS